MSFTFEWFRGNWKKLALWVLGIGLPVLVLYIQGKMKASALQRLNDEWKKKAGAISDAHLEAEKALAKIASDDIERRATVEREYHGKVVEAVKSAEEAKVKYAEGHQEFAEWSNKVWGK